MEKSCATYHLSTQILLEQCAASKKETKVTFLIAPPFVFFPGIVDGNDLSSLECLDKNNVEHVITVTNRTGIRITKKDSSRTTFYFNTLLIKDSTITGNKTHFVNAKIKPIKLDNISKIEVQE